MNTTKDDRTRIRLDDEMERNVEKLRAHYATQGLSNLTTTAIIRAAVAQRAAQLP